MALSRRFDVPSFRDRHLLETLVREARPGWLNFFFVVGVCLVLLGGFVGWVFAAKPYLRMRDFCEVDTRGSVTARDLCVKRALDDETPPTKAALEEKCGHEPTDVSAYDACMGIVGEAREFGIGAAVILGFGVLATAIGVWDRMRVPPIVPFLRQAHRVVWIYESDVVTRRLGFSSLWRTVHIGLDSGETLAVGPYSADVAEIEQLHGRAPIPLRLVVQLAELAPRATIGWSPELQERFAKDPRSLANGLRVSRRLEAAA